ncbi:MAG: alpha/beta fold hydrolase, partial [Putridiphycobacter sp.]|nr:alpha/beta fold hydrolase [Putridiphycobacter sp.]
SPHSIDFNYDVMVEDLHELVSDLGLSNFHLIGHSMGGKTAIGFAAEHEDLLRSLVVVDICHKQYARHHDEILDGLNGLELDKISSRGQADEMLAPAIPNAAVRQFLLKNLYWIKKGKLDWRMNLPVLAHDIDKIIEEIYFRKIDTKTLFIRGVESNYILESDFDQINLKFPNAKIISIENAGHWVHAEQPEIFLNSIVNFISSC